MDRSRPLRTRALLQYLRANATDAGRRFLRIRRGTLALTAFSVVGALVASAALATAVEEVPSVGPWIANTARQAVGTRAVAWVEDRAYDAKDRSNRLLRRGERPKTYWQTPPPAPAPIASAEERQVANRASFRPVDVGPMVAQVAAQGDGLWAPVVDPEHPEEEPILRRTLLHPDAARPWTEVFVVAIDLSRVQIFSVAGAEEPVPLTPEGHRYMRPAVIPDNQRAGLVAAFNGGWKTDHGQYGMEVDGVVIVPPKDRACTVAVYDDGSLRIGTWTALAGEREQMRSWRQTPACLYENGSIHAGLLGEEAWAWGAAVHGETIIRRSAVGLDAKHGILFMGLGNATKAAALAEAMHHAGASDVAELDVNWSFPKFVVFHHDAGGQLVASGLFDGFVVDKDDYIRGRAKKDFFYVARREPNPAANPIE